MRIVAALGGNALLRRGETMSEQHLRANVRIAARALASLCLAGHELVITHGNGPQVGILALQNAAGPEEGRAALDILSAESQGMIGYLIELEMRNALRGAHACATLLSQVVVDAQDAAFTAPTKPIGLHYDETQAQELAASKGWVMKPDGSRWRRVVASPMPLEIPDIDVIETMAARGVVTICLGGGGVPVVREVDGSLRGVEAVVDKDHASALLAREIHADALLLLTDVDAVYDEWRGGRGKPLRRLDARDLDPLHYEAGTMRPKIAAAKAFALATGRPCAIGALEDAGALLEGGAGTLVVGAR